MPIRAEYKTVTFLGENAVLLRNRRKPKPFGVGTPTVDYTLRTDKGHQMQGPLPKEILDDPIGSKNKVDIRRYSWLKEELKDRGAEFIKTVGGNIINIAHRLASLRGLNDIVLHTWVSNDNDGRYITNDLQRDGIEPHIIVIEGVTPKGLVIPRITESGKEDRTIYSFKPQEMQSEFVSGVPEQTDFAIINTLAGHNWAESLTQGIGHLKEKDIPYVYTPGSPQINAFKNGDETQKEAVYNAINGAFVLSVDKDELITLLKGKGLLPSKNSTEMLRLAKKVLGAERLLVTDGAKGAYGMDMNGSMWWVSATPVDKVRGTVGAGDAFTAAAVHILMNTKDIKKALLWGSVSASYAVEQIGAHEKLPTSNDITTRLLLRHPRLLEIDGPQTKAIHLFTNKTLRRNELSLAA